MLNTNFKKIFTGLAVTFLLILWAVHIPVLKTFPAKEKYYEVIDSTHYDSTDYSVQEISSYNSASKLQWVNFHCTASKEGIDLDGAFFMDFWKNHLGWQNPGYNGLIHLDGTLEILKPWDWNDIVEKSEITNGVKGRNSRSLNFAYIGGVDKKLKPKDTRTPRQREVIDSLVGIVFCRLPQVEIMGHRDHPNVKKACPSFDIKKEYSISDFINTSSYFDNYKDTLK